MNQSVTEPIGNLSCNLSWIAPRALKAGDCLAVIALSSPGESKELDLVEGKLAPLGLKVDFFPSCYASHGHLACADQLRIDDLHKAFKDPKYAGVLCMKGGAGSYRLLDQIDYGLIRQHAKVFIGYSDVTAVHLGIQAKARLVTFHGPMAYSKWPQYTLDHFRQVAMASTKGEALQNPPNQPMEVLVPGKASGRLVGGNLSMLVNTLGSPYEVDAKDAILLIEDTLEPTYAIDRMLNALRLAGKFADASGIVLGTWSRCEPEIKNSYPGQDLELIEIFNEQILPAGRPTIMNVQFGHNTPQQTLPLGVSVSLIASRDPQGQSCVQIQFLEDAVHLNTPNDRNDQGVSDHDI